MHTKPTPGPWTLKDNQVAGGISHYALCAPGKDWMICSITPMHLKREQDVANAEFIVRAVNSHEALVEACRKARAELISLGLLEPQLAQKGNLSRARALLDAALTQTTQP